MRSPLATLFGIQGNFIITSAPTGDQGKVGKQALGLTLSTQGTYTCKLDILGQATLQAHVAASAVTGSCPIAFSTLHPDGGTYQASSPAGGNLVAAAQQDLVLSPVGEQFAQLTITIPAGGSVTISRACYNGL